MIKKSSLFNKYPFAISLFSSLSLCSIAGIVIYQKYLLSNFTNFYIFLGCSAIIIFAGLLATKFSQEKPIDLLENFRTTVPNLPCQMSESDHFKAKPELGEIISGNNNEEYNITTRRAYFSYLD